MYSGISDYATYMSQIGNIYVSYNAIYMLTYLRNICNIAAMQHIPHIHTYGIYVFHKCHTYVH